MSLRILSVNKYYRPKGGAETIYLGEMEQLREAGHHVVPFSMKDEQNLPSDYAHFFVDNVNYEKPGLSNKIIASSKILYSFEARSKISSLLDQESFDIAHLHNIYHQLSPSILGALKKRNIPVVASLHDLKMVCGNYKMYVNGEVCERCKGGKHYQLLLNRCTKGSLAGSLVNTLEMYLHQAARLYSQIDLFIAVSHFYRDKLIEFGIDENKIVYLPSFVAVDKHRVAEPAGDYVLYFGRLSEEKGIDTFIDAAAMNPQVPHWIVGTGPEEQALKAQADENGADNIRFLGFQSGDKLQQLVSEALAIVVPSRWYENSPLTVMEGLAHGRPIIGANIGGIPELIETEVDGLLFQSGDASDLARQIASMTANPGLATEMGQRGRAKVERQFNESLHTSTLLDIYDQARARSS